MRRSIYLLLALVLALAVILPVTADHRTLDQQGSEWGTSQQGVESAWIVWETDAPVQQLALDGDDLWVGTYGGGLGRWDRELGHQETFSDGSGLPGSDVTGIARDSSGNLWVTLFDGSVVRSPDGSSFSNLTPPAPADKNAWTIAAQGSNIWVGTLGGGAAQRVGGGWTLHAQEDGLPFDDIYAVGLESDGTPWVGTIGYGVAAYQGGSWVLYDPPLEITNPLSPVENVPNRAITDIAVDSAGVKWFATDGSGIAALDASDANWTVYNTTNSGLCGDFVQSIFLDTANNLWFGTLGGGVCRLGADRSSWTTYKSSNSPQPEDDVLDVVVDSGGGLWLASYDSGLTYHGSLPDVAPDFDLEPRGEPDLGMVGGHGYLLWLDPGSFEWTLAWTGGADSHQFDGSINAPGGLSLIETVGLEAEDQVDSTDESLIINASEGADWDQVTFALDHSVEQLTIALRIDGAYYPYRIQLGSAGEAPGTAPFRISAPQPEPPTVQAGDDLTISEGSYAFLSGSYQDPDSPGGHALLWEFGDGTPVEEVLSTSHFYVDDGVYTATFTATDVHGLVGQDTLLVTVENVPPEVDFFHEPFLPSVGQNVVFEAMLFDPGVEDTHTLTWDFGDGTDPLVGEAVAAEHVFSAGGDYEVTLTAADDDGGVGEASYTLTVLSNVEPTLTMPESLTINEGDSLDTAATFSDPDSSAWDVQVDYGDGSDISTLEFSEETPINLTHIYTDDGIYTIVVTITDDQGAADEGSFEVTVENVAPEAILGDDLTINEGELLIRAGEINDPGADTWSITVDWGDGSELADITPVERMFTLEHLYEDDGAYTLEVCVEDDDLGMGCSSIQVTIENVAPVVIPGPDASGEEGAQIAVTATFSDPGVLDTHTASVVWGDGTSSPADITLLQQGWQVTASHSYGQDGVYTAEICVTDDDGGSGCGALQVLVSNVAPIVEAGPDWQVFEGDPVDLDGASFIDPGFGETYTAEVDWGDGTIDSVLIAASNNQLIGDHDYDDNGGYIVTIKVCDGVECGQDGFNVMVVNSPPVIDAGPDQTIDEGGTLNLNVSFSDPGSADTHTATLDWGDGVQEPGVVGGIAGVVTGSHLYLDEGTYFVTICVLDDDGGEGCDFFTLTVDNLPPAVQPGADIEVDQGEHFTVDLATFADPGVDDTHTATIDWGDETVEPGQVDQAAGAVSGSHAYLDPGLYTVAIEVCDDSGACTSVAVPAEVRATPEGGIEAIKAAIETYIAQDEIDPKAKNSMFSKLDAALKSLEKGKDHTAVNQLGAFINYVEAQRGKKISETAADDLIARAEAIISLVEANAATLPRGLFDLV